jgi:hypothetical protein
MAYTAAQICAIAAQAAGVPGYAQTPSTGVSFAGQWLNTILEELAETFDFDQAKGTATGTFNPSLTSTSVYPNLQLGSGPYSLPSDYQRCIYGDAMWFLQGVAYLLTPCDLAEFDSLVQQAGNQSYPYLMATDLSQSPPVFVVWPPPSGAYSYMIRYYKQPTDITTPEGSATVPWFPFQAYLITKLTARLCGISGDAREKTFDATADEMLTRYLRKANDADNRAKSVKMDRRRFSRNFDRLPNTKTVGW